MLKRRKQKKQSRQILEKQEIFLPDAGFSLIFLRDTCRTLRLSVARNGSVTLKAPAALPLERALSFVRSRLSWIEAKKTFFASHHAGHSPLHAGMEIFYLGRPFTIVPVPLGKKAKACLRGKTLELPCMPAEPSSCSTASALEKAFCRWQCDTAQKVLPRRLARLDCAARAAFGDHAHANSLRVRRMKRRWGSCSVRGEITLAPQLIAMPLPLIDYVIFHELCHLRAMNHGKAFHTLLSLLLPDKKNREERIRIWDLEHPRR